MTTKDIFQYFYMLEFMTNILSTPLGNIFMLDFMGEDPFRLLKQYFYMLEFMAKILVSL